MKNNSSQSRFQRITAKAIVLLLAVVMSISVLPTLSADIFPAAFADENEVSFEVRAGSVADINAVLAGYPVGTVVNMTLYTDINFTNVDAEIYSDGFTGIVIPAGLTVNLFMNGKSISFSRTENGAYRLPYVYGIHNKGTLNVYSASNKTGLNSNADITLINIRTGQTCTEKKGTVYCELEAIRNEGALTVNRGVGIYVETHNEFDDVSGSDASLNANYSEQIANAGTGIYNVGDATCSVYGITVNAIAYGHTIYRTSDNESSSGCNTTAVAYGIYGGHITVAGGSKITTTAHASSKRENCTGSSSDDGRSKISGVAYGIVSDKAVTVTGADISATVNTSADEAVTHSSGYVNLYAAGVYTTTGVVPVMPDVSITVKSSSMNADGGNSRYSEGTVVSSGSMPASSEHIVNNNKGYNAGYTAWPTSTVNAGSFKDETGYVHTTTIATASGNHPTSIVRGTMEGTTRIRLVYRYWKDDSISALDESIVDKNGNKGFTYSPEDNITQVVASPAVLTGVTKDTLIVTGDSLGYSGGAEPLNEYYWEKARIAYAKPGKETFDQFDILKPGTEFETYIDEETGELKYNTISAQGGTVYVFIDYVKKPASYIKVKTPSQIVKTTYTGTNINAVDCGIKIVDSYNQNFEYTADYNFGFDSENKIPVSFSYIGKNAAGVEEKSESGKLPVNAGEYTVTLHIDDSTTYDHNPDTNKNRKGIEFVFQLVIEPSPVSRGNLTREVSALYGQKLNEVIDFSKYAPVLLGSDSGVTGSYSFERASDGDTCKNMGTGKVNVVWTPYDDGSVLCKNYAPTVFEISYVISKGVIKIYPESASVIYGDEDDGKVFTAKVTGLADKDATDAIKSIIKGRLTYSVIVNDREKAYEAGAVSVGEYVIKAKFDGSNLSGALTNYTIETVYGDENIHGGILTVEKRGLTVEVRGQERGYEPDNYSIDVIFAIVDGRFAADDKVAVTGTTAKIDDNYVGQHVFTYENIGELTGDKSTNYFIETVKSASQDGKHYVNIKKGIPNVSVPTVADMFYTQNRTLGDVALSTAANAVAGEWKWVDEEINPTVNVKYYQAQFVPSNKEIYDVKMADIAINVKPTDVVISYNADVVYGDDVPAIMDYSYTADHDPSFSIDGVRTTGNIIPRTSYTKGSPVKAGGYAVEITANDYYDLDGNYNFSVENGHIMVEPKEIVYTVENKEIEYLDTFRINDVKLTFDASLLVGSDAETDLTTNGALPTFVVQSSYDEQGNYNVGTYNLDAHFTGSESPNYKIIVKSGVLTVKKAPLTVKGNDITLVYGSDVPADLSNAFTLVGAKRAETLAEMCTGTIRVTTDYAKGSSVTADGYVIAVDLSAATFRNYEVTAQNGKITVEKATPGIDQLPTATIYHGQSLADAVFAGAITKVPGVFAYEYPTIEPGFKESAYDTFKADFIPEDTVNYKVVSGNVVLLTVVKSEVNGVLSVAGVPVPGETLTVNASGLIPADAVYTFTWYDGNNNVLATGTSYTVKTEDVGKTVTVTAVPDAASIYYGSVSSDGCVVAEDGLTDIRTILTNANHKIYFDAEVVFGGTKDVIYNAEAQAVLFAAKSGMGIGDVVVRYDGSITPPTDAGTYTITVDITAGTVYSPVCGFVIGTLRISPKVCTIIVEAEEKIYDGTKTATAQLVSGISALGDDEVSFVASAVTYMYDTPDAGTAKHVYASYTNCLAGKDAGNYTAEIIIRNATSAVINKKAVVINVSAVSREYQDRNFDVDLDFSFTPVAGDEGLVYVNRAKAKGLIVGYINGTDNGAGEHDVEISGVELAGAKAGNYEISYNETTKVIIVPAVPVYSVPVISETLYYDSARTLKEISLGNASWSWVDETVVPQGGVHYYKAVYTPTDANYASAEYDIRVEVLKAAVTVTAESFTVSYGDIAPTYRYTVKGLTGTDTIDDINGYVLMGSDYSAGRPVGTYVIEIYGTLRSDNYEISYVNGTLTAARRTVYFDATALSRPYAPGNTDVEVTFSGLTNLYSGDVGIVRLSKTSATGKIAQAGAGIRSVQYGMPTLAGENAENYILMPSKADVTVEITKAAVPGVVLPTTGELYYGYSLQHVIFTSGELDESLGRFEMENPSAVIETIGTYTNTYKVVFTPVDTENYATVSQYITITVIPADISGALYFTGNYKSGETLEINLRGVPEGAWMYLNVVWYRVDSPDDAPESGVVVARDTRTYKLKDDDCGKFIICVVQNTADSNYKCNAICVSDYEIEERQRTFWEKLVDWFYNLIASFSRAFTGLF